MGLIRARIDDFTLKEYNRDKVLKDILLIANREKLTLSQLVSAFNDILYVVEQENPITVQSWNDIISEQDSNNS